MRLLVIILLLVLLTACVSVNTTEPPVEPTEDSKPIVEELQNNSQKCPEGYVWSPFPGLLPEGVERQYYCKIDKEWNDFKECTSDNDCTEGEACMSPTNDKDFRCVPLKHYITDCRFYPPDGDGVCA